MNAKTYSNYLAKLHNQHWLVFALCRILPMRHRAKVAAKATGLRASVCHDLIYILANVSDDRQLPAASRPEINHDENSG
jgi:hypothetical protein